MNIVVTGAAGFIGSNLVKKLASEKHSILCIDALIDTTYSKKIKQTRWLELASIPGIELHKVDMSKISIEPLLHNVDVIFNLAAMPGLVDSWADFDLYLNSNITATQKLLQSITAIDRDIKLIHISTSSVYGKIATGDESTELIPFSPYGVTKLAAENLVKAYADNSSFKFNILRYFSVYGPEQRTDMAYSKFIDAIYFGKPINVYGDGKQSRTNTYIEDCINATISVMNVGVDRSIYNISGTDEIDLITAIKIIEEAVGKKAILNFLPPRNGDQLITRGNIAKLIRDTSFKPRIGIREGLKYQVQHFLNSR